jgi:hypothetical protein
MQQKIINTHPQEYNTENADDILEFTPPNSPSPKRGNMRGEPLTVCYFISLLIGELNEWFA